MKKYLWAGVVTLLPLALTIMIVSWLFNLFTSPLLGVGESLVHAFQHKLGLNPKHHAALALFVSRVIALLLLFLLILFLGLFGRKLFFDAFMNLTHRLFMRIPLVKAIWRISKEVTGAVFAEGTKTFQKAVLIPFPGLDSHSLGFLTGDAPSVCKKAIPGIDKSVFIPTAPHPLSGYMLFSPKKNIIELDVSIEDAFKFLLSCGSVHPGEKQPDKNP